ncbi:MAG: exopolysaccharide production repressor protein [Shinella sp.]|jgi:exopolysaccharide production repressor protein|nr:exopolysaccharide production repressor protein [Shinella sp.]
MYAPRALASMIGALIVFAVATYFLTNSLFDTLIQTLICAVLLQVGYFAATLFLVWKEARERRRSSAEHSSPAKPLAEDQPAKLTVSNLNKPGHSNL